MTFFTLAVSRVPCAAAFSAWIPHWKGQASMLRISRLRDRGHCSTDVQDLVFGPEVLPRVPVFVSSNPHRLLLDLSFETVAIDHWCAIADDPMGCASDRVD